jgi:hypothetical protein
MLYINGYLEGSVADNVNNVTPNSTPHSLAKEVIILTISKVKYTKYVFGALLKLRKKFRPIDFAKNQI